MKKGTFIFKAAYCAAVALAAGLCAVSCKNTGETEVKESPLMKTNETSWEENQTSAEGFKIYADYPACDTGALSQNIREWINETLGGTYSGTLNDGQAMLAYYGQLHIDKVKSDLEEFGGNINMSDYAYYVQIRNKFESELFVSYESEIYEYNGGAHGGEVETGCVFRKQDGRRFGWDMFTAEGLSALHNIIKEELKKKYFKESSDEDFYGRLLVDDNARYIFPLPATPPIFVRNGVKFTYQQYEIAPYAEGMPSCTIPYERLTDLFTASVKPLVESTTDEVAVKLSLEKHLNR